MRMQQADLKLDGNAIAGLLREIFTMEMTTAQGTCGGCGTVNPVGRVDVPTPFRDTGLYTRKLRTI